MEFDIFLNKLVDVFGYNTEEKDEIIFDLKEAIIIQLIIDLKKNNVYTTEMNQIEEFVNINDFRQLNIAIDGLSNNPDFQKQYFASAQIILLDWIGTIGESLSEEKRKEAADLLTSLARP